MPTQRNPPKILVFDIETDGRLREASKVHCMWVCDYHTGEMKEFGGPNAPSIDDGIEYLQSAERIVAHNGIDFDVPVLERLYNVKLPTCIDTVIVSRLLWPDRFIHPTMGHGAKPNSIAAWGNFLASKGLVEDGKGDFNGPWDEWTQEMHDYCRQDVVVNVAILKYLLPKAKKFKPAVKHEHEVAVLIHEMTQHGVLFNRPKAERLEQRLITLSAAYRDELQRVFPPRQEEMKTPQWWAVPNPENPKKGVKREKKTDAIKAGAKTYGITQKKARELVVEGPKKIKETPFNPGSTDQIAERLREKYDWRPRELTPSGKPKMDESVISKLTFPEAKILQKSMLVEKRLSQLRGLLEKVEEDGRIYHSVNTIGAVSRRMTHSKPNLGQIVAVRSRFGRQFRRLFIVPKGKKLVGADLSGIEIRALAHRMAKWDNGEYARIVLEDDIHVANQNAGRLLTRDQSKTSFYAFLYGAGDAKIGTSISMHESLTEKQKDSYGGHSNTAIGKKYRDNMKKNLTGLGSLMKWLAKSVQRGFIVSLDGSEIPIRSEHMALNTLLQSDGAIVAKKAMIIMAPKIKALGGKFVLHVHDEWQIEAPEENAVAIGEAMVESMREAGEALGMRIAIDGEYKIGKNWKETH